MFNKETIDSLVQILLIAGALNWATIVFFNLDIVISIVGIPADMYIKIIVGLAGLYSASVLLMPQKKQEDEKIETFSMISWFDKNLNKIGVVNKFNKKYSRYQPS